MASSIVLGALALKPFTPSRRQFVTGAGAALCAVRALHVVFERCGVRAQQRVGRQLRRLRRARQPKIGIGTTKTSSGETRRGTHGERGAVQHWFVASGQFGQRAAVRRAPFGAQLAAHLSRWWSLRSLRLRIKSRALLAVAAQFQ